MGTERGGGDPAPSLRARLLAAVHVRDPRSTRLARLLEGDAEAGPAVRAYALHLAATTELFPRKIAAVCSVVPHPAVRAHLVANLAEEEGLRIEGGSLGADPALRHAAWARALARAAGVGEGEIDAALPGSRSPWFDAAIGDGRWMAALAYVTVGLEANGPRMFETLLPGLRRRGFAEDDLVMLTRHVTLDEAHASIGLDLVCRFANGPEAEDEAVAGTRRGAREFFVLHDTCVRGPVA